MSFESECTKEQPSQRVRLAYLVSHPIQYQAPLLRRIAQEHDIDLTVFFGSDFSVRGYRDAGFGGVDVKWDVPLLDGYKHEFLPKLRDRQELSFASPLNYGLVSRLRGDGDQPAFDALWVHGYASVNSLQAILVAKALGIPVLVRADMWLGDRPRSRLKLALKKIFFLALQNLVDAVLPVGTRNAEYWRHYFGDEIPQFLMPYAVDNEYFARRAQQAAETRSQLQAELDLDPERPVILFAGKIYNHKHCDHLIEAYARLSPAPGVDPLPYLVIVGDGEQRAEIERQAAATGFHSIRFCGFRNQSELPRFFDLAAVFVLPSRYEAWGLIVNEVMSAGCPAIVTNAVGCAPDLIEDGVTGYVYPTGDVEALAVALGRVLETHDIARAMGLRASQHIQNWSFEQNIHGLRQALTQIAKGVAE
jgi:glycosyltransferase involved in cell wall biosynthesis